MWVPCARAASMTGPGRFRFLGVERELASAQDWNNADWPKLWLYNAHYFDDLVATGFRQRSEWHDALLARWVVENPPGCGNGWEPYPASLRIVNWVKWALSANTLDDAVWHSLAVQARWLRKRLEIHLLGNHLWANAKALVFAGAFFEGEEAAAWRAKGLAILQRELGEQILPDGGHFERSPMYHAIVLEGVLDLVQLAAAYPGLFAGDDLARWRDTATRMLRWLRVMSHPDGGIALFNDAALGVAPDVAALADYAVALGLPVDEAPLSDIEALPESGYVRLQAGPAVLIADVAPIGPDYLPGHAHADTLSFELSLQGRRVLVNGGTSTYEASSERLCQRGTAMHNTVQVDGADSSEVWSSFRVARRARPLEVRWGRDGETLWIEAGHDGYRRLPGKVIHRRRWWLESGGLRVVDALTGRFAEARAYFRFAPGLPAKCAAANGGQAVLDGRALRWQVSDESSVAIVPGKWHPRFGADEGCRVLVVSFAGTTLETAFHWS
jgi:uncharacterized heparinase superfamily protein